MLLLSQTLLGLGIKKSMGRRKRTLCEEIYVITCSLLPLQTLWGGLSLTLYQIRTAGGGEKGADRGLHTGHHLSSGTANASSYCFRKLFIPKYQLLLFSLQVSFSCCPPAGRCGTPSLCSHPPAPHADRGLSSSPRREGEAGGHQQGHAWGLGLGQPAAMHSWNMQHVRSLEARQGGQLLPLLAVGSNSCLLYKTHQNLISMRNPSVKQLRYISFVSVRTAKSLHLPQTPCMQSPPAPRGRALQQQAQPTLTGLAGPKRQPHARHCPARADPSPLAVQQVLNSVQKLSCKRASEYQTNKRRWSKQRKITIDLRAVRALWPNKEKASCCLQDEICIFALFMCVVQRLSG